MVGQSYGWVVTPINFFITDEKILRNNKLIINDNRISTKVLVSRWLDISETDRGGSCLANVNKFTFRSSDSVITSHPNTHE